MCKAECHTHEPCTRNGNVQKRRLIRRHSEPSNNNQIEEIVCEQICENNLKSSTSILEAIQNLTISQENGTPEIPDLKRKKDIPSTKPKEEVRKDQTRQAMDKSSLLFLLLMTKSVLDRTRNILDDILQKKMDDNSGCKSKLKLTSNKSESELNSFFEKGQTPNHLEKRSKDLLHYLYSWRGIFSTTNILPLSIDSYVDRLSSGETVGQNESMSNSLIRLGSFRHFPRNIEIFTSNLSKAGFYFTGNNDAVKCYSCGVLYQNWKRGDDPFIIHKELSPNCQHLQTVHSDPFSFPSIPIDTSQTIARQSTSNLGPSSSGALSLNNQISVKEEDSNACSALQNSENGHRVQNEPQQGSQLTSQTRYIDEDKSRTPFLENKSHNLDQVPFLGVNLEKPRYVNYAPLEVRISSFQGWPSHLDQTPRQMAEAGFLFAGYEDYTRCFFCGGGLRNWDVGDDPWIEHARWFPKCAFVLQNKGERFVRAVQAKHEKIMAAEQIQSNGPDNGATYAINESSNGQPQELTMQPLPQAGTSLANGFNGHHNQLLDTVAVISVLEMGYTKDQTRLAVEKLRKMNKDENSITAVDIMSILLDDQNLSTSGASEANLNTPKAPASSIEYDKEVTSCPSEGGSHSNDIGTSFDDADLLLEENRQLRDQRICKVCLDLEASIAFLPCGHLVCCTDCAPAMRKCPICRAKVKGTVKTFLV